MTATTTSLPQTATDAENDSECLQKINPRITHNQIKRILCQHYKVELFTPKANGMVDAFVATYVLKELYRTGVIHSEKVVLGDPAPEEWKQDMLKAEKLDREIRAAKKIP